MARPCPSQLKSLVLCLVITVATILAVAARLAGQQTPPPQPVAQPIAPTKAKTEPKKQKRVWTNDSLQDLSGKSGVSVVGDESAGATEGAAPSEGRPAGPGQGRNADWYRKQLAPLRAEIERLDTEIKRMRDFRKDGTGATGGVDLTRRAYSISPENNIQQYEKRKGQVQARIDALEEEARRDGIPPGELR
jgi:HAMP domain-containing protein